MSRQNAKTLCLNGWSIPSDRSSSGSHGLPTRRRFRYRVQGVMVDWPHSINAAAKNSGLVDNLVIAVNFTGLDKIPEDMTAQGIV